MKKRMEEKKHLDLQLFFTVHFFTATPKEL